VEPLLLSLLLLAAGDATVSTPAREACVAGAAAWKTRVAEAVLLKMVESLKEWRRRCAVGSSSRDGSACHSGPGTGGGDAAGAPASARGPNGSCCASRCGDAAESADDDAAAGGDAVVGDAADARADAAGGTPSVRPGGAEEAPAGDASGSCWSG